MSRLRKSAALATTLLLLIGMLGLAALATGTFSDDDGNVHEGNIEAIAAEGITRGCNPPDNDLYCPSEAVTRGEMAAFLVRAMGYTDDGGGDKFTDDDGSVFEADIDRLATAGVTRGCNPPANTEFCPDAHVTRGQMAAFLVRAMGYTDDGGGDKFTDDDGSVFEADIDRLATAGVTRGCNPPANTEFCPDALVLRDQMASFLARALDLRPITPSTTTSTVATTATSSTSSTSSSTTTTTLPEMGVAATEVGICDSDQVGVTFDLNVPCVRVTVFESSWFGGGSYQWLDPDGEVVHPCPVSGSKPTIVWHYDNYGNVSHMEFQFHVDGEDRDPGRYRFELYSPTDELRARRFFELTE
ncbi:MAG: hypothetical protein ACLFWM_13285 [Actinomycetota bacterium]